MEKFQTPDGFSIGEYFKRIIDVFSSQEVVREHVIKNHDNNLWWPKEIIDSRKRLLFAGLSTRISYNMINHYRSVIAELDKYTYEDIINLPEVDLLKIVGKLGLGNTRVKYIHSMAQFIQKHRDEVSSYSNSDLVQLINDEVEGASYKVAQCCVLYSRGYYCGVMPVDSGMVDMLLPCIGFNLSKDSIAHEEARIELECLVSKVDLRPILEKNNYLDFIDIPEGSDLTWWTHLVLIYYKRFFCNRHNPSICPLANMFQLRESCKEEI